MKINFKEKAIEVFVEGSSAFTEVLMGMLTIGACVTALIGGGISTPLRFAFWLCTVFCVFQIIAAFPFNNLKARHITNYILTFVAITISFLISQDGGETSGVGGFAGVALASYACSFKSKIELDR